MSTTTEIVALTKVKDTKNTVKYEEQQSDRPPIVGVLYVQRWWAGAAKRIKLTLTKDEAAQ